MIVKRPLFPAYWEMFLRALEAGKNMKLLTF